MEVRVNLIGDAAVRRALSDPQLVAGPLKTLLTDAAFIVESEAKDLVPYNTGRLRSSIKTTLKPLGAVVGTPVVYAPHVEFGTKPHVILPRTKKALAFQLGGKLGRGTRRRGRTGMIGGGEWVVVKRVHHPGTKPYPYMRPAAERLKGRMPELLRNLARDIESSFNRKAKGG